MCERERENVCVATGAKSLPSPSATAWIVIGLKAVTYTKISPKMVNPRDVVLAGERRRRLPLLWHAFPGYDISL